MPEALRRVLRRALRTAAVVTALAVAFATGVVTGVVGTRTDGPATTAAPAAGGARAGVIDEAADRIAAGAARPVDRAALEQAAVAGMLRALGDPWSSYTAPGVSRPVDDYLDGRYSGVGVWLRAGGRTGVEIGSVQPQSPAARAGLAVGDVVVSIDGERVTGDVPAAAARLRGSSAQSLGRPVRVVVRRAGVDRTVTLRRVSFVAADVAVERLAGGVTLVRIAAFSRGVGRQLRQVLAADRLAYTGGVLLDLRANPGGLLTEGVEVASAFLDGGLVVSYDRRGQPRRVLTALGRGDVSTPVVVLVDGGTASAAEVVAAALQDRGRAVLVGAPTYGKGTVQEPTRLSDGSTLELTVGRYRAPSGRLIDGAGVQPDVLVPATMPAAVAERRAMDVLSGLVAALSPDGRG